ncbi:MAG: histidine--tRNA ligase [Bacteroidetes bacterium]|nr:histidine--tRNA ligase [Bacteroidota bacterium]
MSKPSLPPGTRDFCADTVRKRRYILDTIRSVFECYGFEPLETPAMENLDTLLGKYGEEGDKLIFKILNNGLDNPEKEKSIREEWEKVLTGKSSKQITERALRYDLTIPLARYVATWHQQLPIPFKRYQIQPVWRADRPQKGRYREFYQCDVDVVGSSSLFNEIELGCIAHQVFTKLGLPGYTLRINHRKLLVALAENCGGINWLLPITVAIDKLDKIGLDKVKDELRLRGLAESAIDIVAKYLQAKGNGLDLLQELSLLLGNEKAAQDGFKDLTNLFNSLQAQGVTVQIDPTLARGLNYYTGVIFELQVPKTVKIGSIGGGGRYDDLTGLFGVPNMPGVGISFGVDRIYDVLEELDLFPATTQTSTQVLFFNLGEEEANVAFQQMQQLRQSGISCELYPEAVKFDKQFKYAERKKITTVIILGQKEIAAQSATIKNLQTGNQETVAWTALSKQLLS